jgi:hypothetical protein
VFEEIKPETEDGKPVIGWAERLKVAGFIDP